MKNLKNDFKYPQTATTKRIISGTFFTLAGEGINAIKHILLIPLFLRAWGNIVYGEWLTIYALISYLSLSDIGMQNYVTNHLIQTYSRGNVEEHSIVFQSALRLYLIIILAISLVFLIFIFLAPLDNWFNISITSSTTIKLTTFILGIYLLSGIIFGLILGLYHSFGEYPRRALIVNIQEIILIVILVVALFLKSNFIIVSLLHFIPLFILISYCLWDIKRRHREVRFGFSQADWKLFPGLIGPGLFFLIVTMTYALRIQGSILITSSILGAGAVTIFSVHRTLANLIAKIVNSINNAFWPELTATEARDDYKKMQILHNFLIKLSLFLSLSFAIFLFFTGKDIIRIWTRNRIDFQPLLWLLFLAYLPFFVFGETNGVFQLATNRHKKYALLRAASTILGIVLAIILTKIWGIVGTLSGFIIAELLVCSWFVPIETLKIVKANRNDFWFKTVGKGFFIILPQILVGWILSNYISNIFLQWILLILGIFFTGAIISYLFWLTKEEVNSLIKLFC